MYRPNVRLIIGRNVGTWWPKLGRKNENGESPKERVPSTGSTSGTVKTAENVGTVAENVDGNAKTVNPTEVRRNVSR